MDQSEIRNSVVLNVLRQELVGPAPDGQALESLEPGRSFNSFAELKGPWRQTNGEEILTIRRPTNRYGVGVLYPAQSTPNPDDAASEQALEEDKERDFEVKERLGDPAVQSLDLIKEGVESQISPDIEDEIDMRLANATKPSSFGVTFLADIGGEGTMKILFSGGVYSGLGVVVRNEKRSSENQRKIWLRRKIAMELDLSFQKLASLEEKVHRISGGELRTSGMEQFSVSVDIQVRNYGGSKRLLTIAICNRTKMERSEDAACIFQVGMTVDVAASNGAGCILPYPGKRVAEMDEEEQSFELLYRRMKTFAVGHGCAADWEGFERIDRVKRVRGEMLPSFETPSMTPDIKDFQGNPIKISMKELGYAQSTEDLIQPLERLSAEYQKWIEGAKTEAQSLSPDLKVVADRNIGRCEAVLTRMKEGIEFLRGDSKARTAFLYSNQAILHQQLLSGQLRNIGDFAADGSPIYDQQFQAPDLTNIPLGKGQWRPFQIAFLLISLRSAVIGSDPMRDNVELIWFPTGGGKTEAYLGLIAFSLFFRRLQDPSDAGTSVLMRYTLRLLTSQQFQRAATLICVMEKMRRENAASLGTSAFSIGLWLGGDITPNSRKDALEALNKMKKSRGQNAFGVTKCPWCQGQMGPVEIRKGGKGKKIRRDDTPVVGYVSIGKTVRFKCFDVKCAYFLRELPLIVIDEDIYDQPPTLVIGTVDKFANLAWKPRARSLFGLDSSGERKSSPPSLIVQDELHLISGPLGSMVGLYESLIEEMCTDRRGEGEVRPKIISSTATIKRFEDQVRGLYGRVHNGRTMVSLFPPPGINAQSSFFGELIADDSGTMANSGTGRLYVGVFAPGLRSIQTIQVRALSALLQAPMALDADFRDPWWTPLIFFNSLRELGTTLSLFQSDIPDYLLSIMGRLSPGQVRRRLFNFKELTSRLRSDEVPKSIDELSVQVSQTSRAVDACLASNIIEVGIDIERLALMCIVGQPKTTSQYIQVSGRVGRNPSKRPGLVVTLYGVTKPRDRSHYEKFRSYHERLYAQVEPTSVTPFSLPVLDRALHAIMVGFVRQHAKDFASSPKFTDEIRMLLSRLENILTARINAIDPNELATFQSLFNMRRNEWIKWQKVSWEKTQDEENFLQFRAGSFLDPRFVNNAWETPSSLRNVDAQCMAEITGLYRRVQLSEEG